MMIDDETLQIYVEESEEHLADIEKDLLTIEQMGADLDENLVNKVFRAAHSIKGGAGFMGLTSIKDLSHRLENVLGLIRDREMTPNSEIVNVLLSGFDRLNELIENVNKSNDMDISEKVAALENLTHSSLSQEDQESVDRKTDINLPNGRLLFQISEFDMNQARKGGKFVYLAEYDLIHDMHYKNKTPLDIITKIQQSGILIESKVDVASVGTLEEESINRIPFYALLASIIEPDLISDILELDEKYIHIIPEDGDIEPKIEEPTTNIEDSIKNHDVSVPEGVPAKTSQQKIPAVKKSESAIQPEPKKNVIRTESTSDTTTKADPSFTKETSLRVNISLLDSLMNLAGELVLSRNQLIQSIASDNEHGLDMAKQRIDIVTSELQDAIMLTRMQPIGKVFNKFPRVVRDLSRDLNKEVILELEGKDVELDKSIIEGLNDPLTHMIRNSVDHGVETPEERRKAGKKEVGRVLMRAYHEAGQINIEIIDDGKGIDGDALAYKVIEKGLMTEDQVEALSDKERVNLIFLPGFSTAEIISDVSGRGVGMDVVKSNLDSLGGVVDVQSIVGEGTTFRIKLPLTLAIVPSLLVSVNNERFAIPQVNLDELLRIPANQVKDRVEVVGDAKVVRLRETLLPVLSLSDVLGLDAYERDEKRAVNIAVVSAGSLKYGLIVDELHDSVEIVVKPLGRHLKNCNEYAGATILGDGRVALILDVGNLASRAELTNIEGNLSGKDVEEKQVRQPHVGDVELFLLFRSSHDEQFAVPLNLVSRIERIKAHEMEKLGERQVIQYMGGSIPLFAMHEVAAVKPIEDLKTYIVIVFIISGKEFGLLVTGPLDTSEVAVDVDDRVFKQPGVLGSMVIGKHTTLIVDIYGFIKTIQPQWLESSEQEESEKPTLLLAEDAAFFREQVRAVLSDEGFNVIVAEDGAVAWDLLQMHNEEISIVVTDIEMPNMNGFELTQKIKKDPRFSSLPVIAVTSLSEERHRIEGKKVGIDDYQLKLDRQKLIESIKKFLSR
ncbi:signal transduction histidine kinase, chemotaxis protein CheA [Candidatus Magnetomorum sp. HK-1]|nr:signal transduction histidine kinase, chemotaxis protein CheA [Candidatus Magnetomorum sp. HK-1]